MGNLVGWFAELRLPPAIMMLILRAYSALYRVKIEEASLPLESYPSLKNFFLREIKATLRPSAQGIVSPADGTLRTFGAIRNGIIPSVKGGDFSVMELLRGSSFALRFKTGHYFNIYLSPADCHHVYAPLDCTLIDQNHIPGFLFPVNDFFMARVEKLFCKNERKVGYFQTSRGLMAFIMIGAQNVGKIYMDYEESQKKVFKKGEKLGSFWLGSSVVVLFEGERMELMPNLAAGTKIRYGQSLAAE